MWWKKYIFPAISPAGIISAVGGAWNGAIATKVFNWGSMTLKTEGLGAFISVTMDAGQNPEAVLGCIAMCFMVFLCIIFIWQPLYHYAETRLKSD